MVQYLKILVARLCIFYIPWVPYITDAYSKCGVVDTTTYLVKFQVLRSLSSFTLVIGTEVLSDTMVTEFHNVIT